MKQTLSILVIAFILFAPAITSFAADSVCPAGSVDTGDGSGCQPTGGTTAPAPSATAGSVNNPQFVALTSLPGLDAVSTSKSLAPFLSQVYKICIGLAAVLAVLQLMRAGVIYMGGDSITEKSQARELIGTSLAGLLLVLSPVIVFSIINPSILNLDINAKSLTPDSSSAAPSAVTAGSPNSASECSPACTGGQVCSNSTCISPAANAAQCQYSVLHSVTSATTCPAGESRTPDSCCTPSQGYQCCGKK